MEQCVAGALARFAHVVRERFADAVIDIRLFGSHARSNAHEESDVDVAVVLEEAGWETRREIIDLASNIGFEMARLQKYREEADHSRAFVIDAEGAREEIEAARAFVEADRAQLPAIQAG